MTVSCSFFRIALLAICSLALNTLAADLASPVRNALPFSIEAGSDVSSRFAGAPRLHSFAWAQWEGKWIFLAGRTSGFHGMGGGEADFPNMTANTRIWVVDPSGTGPAKTYSLAVADLPASLGPVKDQWTSSNPLYFQDKDTLYIGGGYGKNSAGSWVTFPVLSTVRLPDLVEGVIGGHDSFSKTIQYTESPFVQVTGGEFLKLDDGLFYVIGGHTFTGTYSEFEAGDEKNTPASAQIYIGEIRKLRITRDPTGISIQPVERFANPEFARRDLNATYQILADGRTLGAAAFGGVFTREQLGFTKPIYWDAKTMPVEDMSFDQKMSGYTCANLLFFDPDTHAMYTTFFGGISRWSWNYGSHSAELVPIMGDHSQRAHFEGLTWIDHVTTIAKTAHHTSEHVHETTRLPGYIGTNAAFLPVPGLAKIREDANVFDLKALRGKRTLVGYLYGGVRAYPKEFPYGDDARPYKPGNIPTKASDLIVPVYVTVPAN